MQAALRGCRKSGTYCVLVSKGGDCRLRKCEPPEKPRVSSDFLAFESSCVRKTAVVFLRLFPCCASYCDPHYYWRFSSQSVNSIPTPCGRFDHSLGFFANGQLTAVWGVPFS